MINADCTTRPKGGTKIRADVLLIDDDRLVLRALERMLKSGGYSVFAIDDAQEAAREAMAGGFEIVVSDINMPGISGMELLDMLRAYGCDVPFVLMTGAPSLDSACSAIELGVQQYLTKPVTKDAFLKAVERGVAASRERRLRREAKVASKPEEAASFERALRSLWMAYQPIVSLAAHGPIAYEALMRSDEPGFNNPGALLEYAERNGRMTDLGRTVRDLCADAAARLSPGLLLFVNLHVHDLFDPTLFSEASPLTSYANKVVLEITERGALDEVSDIGDRIRRLRALGFRVAIDDLGAGYAGLTSIAVLEPDFVKLDMSLTRDLAASSVKQRLVASMVEACRDCGMTLVAEGVETMKELLVLRQLGCEILQGYYFARPSPEFVKVAA